MRIVLLLELASSGQLGNCSFDLISLFFCYKGCCLFISYAKMYRYSEFAIYLDNFIEMCFHLNGSYSVDQCQKSHIQIMLMQHENF